jgi:membrane protein
MKSRLLAPFAPLLDLIHAIERHSLFTHAASTAFYVFLSLPPALLSLVVLVGMIPIERWSEDSTRTFLEALFAICEWIAPSDSSQGMGVALEMRLAPLLSGLQDMTTPGLVQHIEDFLERTLPPDMARAIGGVTSNVLGNPKPSLLTASFFVILWSSSGATRSAMRALGAIYEVRRRSWFVRNAIGLGLTVGFLLTWTLLIAVLPISNALAIGVVRYLGLDAGVLIGWSTVNWCVGGGLLFLSVLTLSRFGPDASLRLRALVPGTLLTLCLWIALTYALGQWMERSWSKYNATYGALAGVIVLLLWCYTLSLGLLLGAELNTAILRWRRRAWDAGPEDDVSRATRAAVEGEVVEDPLEHVVASLGHVLGQDGEERRSRGE